MTTGWKFPFEISGEHGRVAISEWKENIRESVRIILLTEPGERMMHPHFGTKLHQFLFESMDSQTEEMIRREVCYSLEMWEKRIQDIEVRTDFGPEKLGVIHVMVSYCIKDPREEDRVEVVLGD